MGYAGYSSLVSKAEGPAGLEESARLMILLYNFQTARIGINQIQTVFMLDSEHYIGDEFVAN